MSNNHLPDLNLNDSVAEHNSGLQQAADERYRKAVGFAHAGLVKLTNKAAAQHDNPTDAMNAAADLLERFADGVQSNGDAIVASLAQQQAASTVQVAQVRELESQVAALQANNADLERGARRASNLQAQLDQAEAKNNRLERELLASQAEVQELKSNADKPNPLSERVRQLEAENSDLKAKLTKAEQEKTDLERQLQEAQQANQPQSQVPSPPPAAPEPDGQSGVSEPMVGGFQGEGDNPTPRRGWFSRLPGHGRNQGGEA